MADGNLSGPSLEKMIEEVITKLPPKLHYLPDKQFVVTDAPSHPRRWTLEMYVLEKRLNVHVAEEDGAQVIVANGERIAPNEEALRERLLELLTT